MARLDCGLQKPAALPLDLLSDTENGQNGSRAKTENSWFGYKTVETRIELLDYWIYIKMLMWHVH